MAPVHPTKQEIVDLIARALGQPPRKVSSGSTEPKTVFIDVIQSLRLRVSTKLKKPALAKAIAKAAGLSWDRQCDSTSSPSGGGGTVTRVGLLRVLEAIVVLL